MNGKVVGRFGRRLTAIRAARKLFARGRPGVDVNAFDGVTLRYVDWYMCASIQTRRWYQNLVEAV